MHRLNTFVQLVQLYFSHKAMLINPPFNVVILTTYPILTTSSFQLFFFKLDVACK